MIDREKVIKGLKCCGSKGMSACASEKCPYYPDKYEWDECTSQLANDALELLKEQENCVSIPFTWLVKFCTHLDFHEPMSDEERAERWKEKLSQQLGVKWDEAD